MAAVLERTYALTTLSVTLLPGRSSALDELSGSSVQFTLERRRRAEVARSVFDAPARAMGIPRRLDWDRIQGRGGYHFRLPDGLADWLGGELITHEPDGRALWLHLVKPFGYLGMVAWECLLAPVLACPILRLPEFALDPPQQTPSVIDAALCCPMGGEADDGEAARTVLAAAWALSASGRDRKVRIDVFASPGIFKALQFRDLPPLCRLQEVKPGDSLLSTYVGKPLAAVSGFVLNPIRNWLNARLRQPDQASRDVLAAASDPVRSPWLRAVRTALGSKSVDVIHVISDATLSLERGALMLDGGGERNVGAHLVLAEEFLAFQAQVGAWAVGVSTPARCFSDMGMRQFAGALAQWRPGPMLYHDAILDTEGKDLIRAYSVLMGSDPTPPPRSPALFLYCEPFRVEGEASREDDPAAKEGPAPAAILPPHDGVSVLFEKNDNVASWIAASERFVDLYRQRMMALARAPGETGKTLGEMRDVLTRLQDTVAKLGRDQER